MSSKRITPDMIEAARPPAGADLSHIAPDLRPLAMSIDLPTPDPENLNSGHDIAGIRESLAAYGQLEVANANLRTGYLETWHGRRMAAKELGWEYIAINWNDHDKKTAIGFSIASNALPRKSRFLPEKLLEAVKRVPDRPTGINAGILEKLRETSRKKSPDPTALPLALATATTPKNQPMPASKPTEAKIDKAEQLQREWGTELGQTWILPSRKEGKQHRLICGDCTDQSVIKSLMQGQRANCVATDPPYAVFGSSTGIGKNLQDDNMILPFCREVYRIACDNTGPNSHVYICCDWKSFNAWWSQVNKFDLRPLNCIVWDKGDGGIGTNYTNRHEFVLFFNREASQQKMTEKRGGMRLVYGKANVQRFNVTQGKDRQHNAAKPVGLFEVFIDSSTDEGEIILDPFSGSGTTIIAAENLGRECRAVEVAPRYVAIALQRYKDTFGITPELANV